MQHRENNGVVHELKAGVVRGDQVGRRDAEQLTEDGAQFGQPVLAAVVSGVGAVGVSVVRFAGQAEKSVGQVELLGRRLSPGQVQGELLGLKVGIVALLQQVLGVQLLTAEGLKRHRCPFPDKRGHPAASRRGPRAPARAR